MKGFNRAMVFVGKEAKAFGGELWKDIFPVGTPNKKLYDVCILAFLVLMVIYFIGFGVYTRAFRWM